MQHARKQERRRELVHVIKEFVVAPPHEDRDADHKGQPTPRRKHDRDGEVVPVVVVRRDEQRLRGDEVVPEIALDGPLDGPQQHVQRYHRPRHAPENAMVPHHMIMTDAKGVRPERAPRDGVEQERNQERRQLARHPRRQSDLRVRVGVVAVAILVGDCRRGAARWVRRRVKASGLRLEGGSVVRPRKIPHPPRQEARPREDEKRFANRHAVVERVDPGVDARGGLHDEAASKCDLHVGVQVRHSGKKNNRGEVRVVSHYIAVHLELKLGALLGAVTVVVRPIDELAVVPVHKRIRRARLDVRVERVVPHGAEAGCNEDLQRKEHEKYCHPRKDVLRLVRVRPLLLPLLLRLPEPDLFGCARICLALVNQPLALRIVVDTVGGSGGG
mmetsp:Transcript_4593/g.11789  ORF Transcript_4593/g.11789 Transcript_4593/m.11789 type:complete len:387 (+) Transcript_4593:934-2094(+)